MRRKRRNHSAECKAKVILMALRGARNMGEVAEQFEVYPNQIRDWKKRLAEGAAEVFALSVQSCGADDETVQALHEVPQSYRHPEIFNTDQGWQFAREAFTSVLIDRQIPISMDGKGRWVDNVFAQRLWLSLKYEQVYLKAYDSVAHARAATGRYMVFFNSERRHHHLGRRRPETVYDG